MENTTAINVKAITHEAYEGYIYSLCLVANLSLLLYSTVLGIAQEVEHVWSLRKFSLPSLLYIFTRYGFLLSQATNIVIGFLPLGSACKDVSIATSAFNVFALIGVQGLLVARAYSLCKGHKVMAGLLAFTFFSTLVLDLFDLISFHECISTLPDELLLLQFLITISVIVDDLLVGGICLWNVWGIWQMKRKSGLRGGHDLASLLVEQIATRFIFVVTFTVTGAIIDIVPQTIKNPYLVASFTIFQKTLSIILLCDFTLGLRQRNSASIAASNISLPTLQIRSILQHIHESFIVEFGDNNNRSNVAANNDGPEPESVPLDHVGHRVQDQSV